jgi:hypothetical protein
MLRARASPRGGDGQEVAPEGILVDEALEAGERLPEIPVKDALVKGVGHAEDVCVLGEMAGDRGEGEEEEKVELEELDEAVQVEAGMEVVGAYVIEEGRQGCV